MSESQNHRGLYAPEIGEEDKQFFDNGAGDVAGIKNHDGSGSFSLEAAAAPEQFFRSQLDALSDDEYDGLYDGLDIPAFSSSTREPLHGETP